MTDNAMTTEVESATEEGELIDLEVQEEPTEDVSAEDVERITAEAHNQGMMVWSHGFVGPASPWDAINANVDVISHVTHIRWAAEDRPVESRQDMMARLSDSLFWSLPIDDDRVVRFLGGLASSNTSLDPSGG